MKIEIKNRWNNDVLFTHEVENNTIKITLLEAIKRNAYLRNADLSDANLWNANGNCREIKTVQTDIWHVCMTANVMQIGCKQHTLEQWDNFSDDEISDMDEKALGFWKNWKKLLFKIHKKSFKKTQ